MKEEEKWLKIKDFEDYKISSFGRVKSLNYKRTGKEGFLKASLNRDGYLKVVLCKNGKHYTKKIHQLVAIAFLNHTPCGFDLVVNHINFIKIDNRVVNLEIITQRENSNLKHIKSSSKYIGVSWNKRDRKWSSQININNQNKHLGYFDCEIEASTYYENALKAIENGEDIQVKQKNSRVKYKGVYWHKGTNKWQSSITVNGKNHYLGLFDNEEEAYKTCQAAININNMKKDFDGF